ncbi:hypothetical protein Noda2021_05600 [Candidatus Dependentiae bacterium Noda2021]|nr:hypothetical protein Noda2021_05600 [Candidatus Dependentiae bacterium Noda2021]
MCVKFMIGEKMFKTLLLFLLVFVKGANAQEFIKESGLIDDDTKMQQPLNVEIGKNEDIEAKLLKCLQLSQDEAQEIELYLKSAPVDAQNIVEQLKDADSYKNKQGNSVIFVGPPGAGKTTIAKAIASKLLREDGWEAVFIKSGDLLGHVRNKTRSNLSTILDAIAASKKKTIIIIDELNELLENAHDSHYDTSATAKYLWQFLDTHKKNTDLYFIGTMNRDTQLPQPMKNRIVQRRIIFGSTLTEDQKLQEFLSIAFKAGITFEEAINKDYIKARFKNLSSDMARDNTEFVYLLRRIYARSHNITSGEIAITRDLFDITYAEYQKNYEEIEYHHVIETQSDRQDRIEVQRILIDHFLKEPTALMTLTSPVQSNSLKLLMATLNDKQKAEWLKIIERLKKNNSYN